MSPDIENRLKVKFKFEEKDISDKFSTDHKTLKLKYY